MMHDTAQSPRPVIDWAATLKRLSGRADLLKRALAEFSTRRPGYVDELLQLSARGAWRDAEHSAHALKGLAANLGMTRLMQAASLAECTLRDGQPLTPALVGELTEASAEATAAAAQLSV